MTDSPENRVDKVVPTDVHLQRVHEALLSAFAFDELRMLTRTRLETDLEQVVPVQGRNLMVMAYDLVRVFAARPDGLSRLIGAAGAFAPTNRMVAAMVQELGPVAFDVLPLPKGFADGDTVHGDVVQGDKVAGDKIEGDKVAGDKIVYEAVAPEPVDEAVVAAARARLDEMPVDVVAARGDLPHGSFLPLGANPHFVGRQEDLMGLARSLKGDEADAVAINQIAAATGLGGIGKTQLAVEFAHRYGCFFEGGVFWVSFADGAGIEMEIARSAGNVMGPGFGNQELGEQVRQVLGMWQDPRPKLLVFDNCEDPTLLDQWRPPTGGARVLVTSRRSDWDVSLGVVTLALGTLARAESVALLAQFTPRLASPGSGEENLTPSGGHEDAEQRSVLAEVAEELGDLPLALHLAGSYLLANRFDVTPAQYLARLRQPDLLGHRSMSGGQVSPTRHEQHVGRTFALSYDQLDAGERVGELALDVLHRAACFAPGEPIPRTLLEALPNDGDDDDEAAMAVDNGVETVDDGLMLGDGIRRLAALGLVEVEPQQGAVLLHRLVASYVRGAEPTRFAAGHEAVLRKVLDKASRQNSAGYPKALQAWQVHLRHVTDGVYALDNERASRLCNALGYHLYSMGEYEGARPYYERVLDIYEQILGEVHGGTALSLNNLGALLQTIGEYEKAKPLYERGLYIRQQILGEMHPDTARSLNNLGALLQAMGEYEKAKPLYERGLYIRQQILGEMHPDTARSLNNLGALLQAMGEYEKAKPLYERGLYIRQQILGEMHPDTARSLNNLGALLQAMGEHKRAKPLYEKALEINELVTRC